MSGDRAVAFRALYRRLRIGDQRDYYRRRRDEYRDAHRQAVIVRNVLLLGAAIAGPIGQLGNGDVRAWTAVAAAVFAGLAAALTGYESLIDFARLSNLYHDTMNNLDLAAADWDGLAPEADHAALVAHVEGVLRTENGQWGQLAVESAESLRAQEPGQGDQPPGPGGG